MLNGELRIYCSGIYQSFVTFTACIVMVGQLVIWAIVMLSDGSPPCSGLDALGEGPSSLNHPLNHYPYHQNYSILMEGHRW